MHSSGDTIERLFHYHVFQNRVLESSGSAFQTLFEQIMMRAYPTDFQPVRAYGNQGDWKCDGRKGGQYFQCYAPDNLKVTNFIAKIKTDLKGCLEKWGSAVKEWTLVHNAKVGLPAQVINYVDQLKKTYPEIHITFWDRQRLWQVVEALPLQKRNEILGPVPSRGEVQNVTFAELKVIVDYLSTVPPDATPVGTLVPPDKKIKYNRLGRHSENLIRIGICESYRVEDYINRHPNPAVGEVLRKRFVQEYLDLRDKHHDEPDLIFGKLLAFASINSQDTRIQGAGLAVLVYFFVTCDVFETSEGIT
ncbi:hypothetical protein E308F_10940 [Moorella sp. E308F]|uniref:ABC-three component system protein n=1 Tax=Moorella sp. E308F TaxID=2572682 RepID=UPI0010FFBCDC|nr:ABC-three component system protein [Moorella sp. E308F]GEA14850.1 hypothetical protein E308F_10940 [Moorella sp. E308F]